MWGMASCGSQTAFNKFAGYSGTARSVASEEYDGTSWTTITNYPQTTSDCHGCGTQTASLIFGGMVGPGPGASAPSFLTVTNSWTGSAYVAEGSMNTGRYLHGGTGTETAGLCIAGQNYPPGTKIKNVEEYNGTSWTEVTDIPTTASSMTAGGTQTAGIYAGGDTTGAPDVAAVTAYSYDGTTWTSVADMPAGKYQAGATKQATNTDMVFFGGTSGGPPADTTSSTTFELSAPTSFSKLNEGQIWYNTTGNALKYTGRATGAWASGGALNTGRRQIASSVMAPSSGMLGAGGTTPGVTANTETYDGTSWTEVYNINTARRNAGGCGTVNTAVVIAGGQTNGTPTITAICELYNGTSWTEVNNLNAGKTGMSPGGAGSSTAGLLAGGLGPSNVDQTESWDGTCWTELNNLNTAKESVAQFGTQTASLVAGGWSTTYLGETETWNGTSWTEVNNLNTARGWATGGGSTTAGIVFGGTTGTATAVTEKWDGTSWTEVADMATARETMGGGGSQVAALGFGGDPGHVATTEEWDESLTVKTVTVS